MHSSCRTLNREVESEVYYVPHVIIPSILFKWIVATNQFDIGGFICHYIYTYKYEYIHIHIIWNILIYTYIHTWFLMFSLSIHHIIVPCGYHVSICFYLPPPMGTHLVFADHEIAWPMIQKVGLVLIEIYAGMGFNGIQWDLKKWLNGNLPWFNGNL